MSKYLIGVQKEEEMIKSIMVDLRLASIYSSSLIRDVCYKGLKGRYSQIDATLICELGIFCIEMKSWSGTVCVSTDKDWRLIRNNGRTEVFPSPVYQNARHASNLQSIIWKNIPWARENKIPVRSVIIFDNKSILDDNMFKNVMNCKHFSTYLNRYDSILSMNQLNDLNKFLIHLVDTNKYHFERQHRQHIEEARNRKMGR